MVEIANNIWWTGYIDWDLRDFHGYSTPKGSSYNAYLILDEKPTLIDTVKHYGFAEMLSRIKEVIEPSKIQYIVSNHVEMDHSGSIGRFLEFCPTAEVVCSPKGQEGLSRHFLSGESDDREKWKFRVVNTGDTLNIGKRNLKFFLTPMVHWPDSMAAYLEEDSILFPNDAFGQHYASYKRFVYEVGVGVALNEAAKYYANIVMPYGSQVVKVLEGLKKIDIEMICPSHGLIWRRKDNIEKIINFYNKWARYESDEKVVIIYDTMWGSTKKAALKLFSLLDRENIPVQLINMKINDISDIITEVMLSKVVMLGSPVLNNKILPRVGGFLTYLRGLKPKNRFGFTFGSYGWSKSGFKELEDSFKEAGIELIDEGRYFKYIPSGEELTGLSEVVSKVKDVLKV